MESQIIAILFFLFMQIKCNALKILQNWSVFLSDQFSQRVIKKCSLPEITYSLGCVLNCFHITELDFKILVIIILELNCNLIKFLAKIFFIKVTVGKICT